MTSPVITEYAHDITSADWYDVEDLDTPEITEHPLIAAEVANETQRLARQTTDLLALPMTHPHRLEHEKARYGTVRRLWLFEKLLEEKLSDSDATAAVIIVRYRAGIVTLDTALQHIAAYPDQPDLATWAL